MAYYTTDNRDMNDITTSTLSMTGKKKKRKSLLDTAKENAKPHVGKEGSETEKAKLKGMSGTDRIGSALSTAGKASEAARLSGASKAQQGVAAIGAGAIQALLDKRKKKKGK